MAFVIRDSSLLAPDSWVIPSVGRILLARRPLCDGGLFFRTSPFLEKPKPQSKTSKTIADAASLVGSFLTGLDSVRYRPS